LLVRQAAAETDPAARFELLYRAEAIFLDETPIIPIYYYVATNCYDSDRWGGCEPNLLNNIYPKYVYRKGVDRPHPVLPEATAPVAAAGRGGAI
jgi:ABC-type oligopeptide transport system substrate-binding subunit